MRTISINIELTTEDNTWGQNEAELEAYCLMYAKETAENYPFIADEGIVEVSATATSSVLGTINLLEYESPYSRPAPRE